MKFNKVSKPIAMLILTAAILIFINILISDFSLRIDATENNIYSLSKATHKILDKTNKEINLIYFNNASSINDIPGEFKAYAKRITDLLKEYETYSNGNIKLELVNPKPDSEEEDRAETYGLKGIDLPGDKRLYMGLAAVSMDKEEIIPFFDPSNESKLEYELTRIISKLETVKQPKVGILTSSDIFGSPAYMQMRGGSPKWYFIETLEKQYQVEKIDPKAKELPKDLAALICFLPKDTEKELVASVEKYVENGGRLIMLADSMAVLDQQSQMKPYIFPFNDVFKKWGVTFNEKKAIVDLDAATRIMGRNNRPELNPGWLSIQQNQMNQKNIITSDLESLLFPIAATFEINKQDQLDYETLAFSSKKSSLYDPSFLQFGGINAIKKDFSPSDKQYPIAVKITGKFKKEAEKNGAVILIGDTDFLFDQFYMQKQNFLGFEMANMFNDNLIFMQNCVEILCGEEELINIRSRSTTLRPFTKVQELENKAKEKWLETEKRLAKKAEETSQKLRALEQTRNEKQSLVLTKEQEQEIKKFRQEKKEIDKQLKKVRRELRADIESLGVKLKLLNILLIPFLIAVIGIVIGIKRKNR